MTGTGFATHDLHWIRRNIEGGWNAHLVDLTSAFTVISLFGPRSRDVLSTVSHAPLDNEGFPFATVKDIRVCGAPVRALRITYFGELGWELHVPVEYAVGVYDGVMKAGRDHGIANAGYRAIESLRLEKGYRAWGAELTPDHSPLEAGLGWAVKLDRQIPFLGREAVVAQRSEKLRKRLACFTVDDPEVVLLGRETILRDGERVGWLTSGGFGYSVNKSIDYGYVRNADGVDRGYLQAGAYELEVATRRVPASIHFGALYDSRNERIRQ